MEKVDPELSHKLNLSFLYMNMSSAWEEENRGNRCGYGNI